MKKILEQYIKKKPFIFIDQLVYRFSDHNLIGSAAELTYFLVLSIFPFLIALLNILNYVSLTKYEYIMDVIRYAPEDIQKIIEAFVNDLNFGSNENLLSIAVIGGIIAASTGFRAIIRALNRAYEYGENRGVFKKIGLSILFTAILIFMITVIFIGLIFSEQLGKLIFQLFNIEVYFLLTWKYLRLLISFLFMIFIFALIYKYSPNIKSGDTLSLKSTFPGAVFTSLSWIILSLIFSYYVSNFGRYSVTYGSLGGVIVLLVWLFISSIVIILGGEINATLKNLKNRDYKIDSERSFVLKHTDKFENKREDN
ncbi:MAG: YihY/virulence factor BrkB family protein [Tissierellales bacterium]|jgi:membrane protein|nr:YihY/virulence factor BrkB family protein [Tissierellales bacterium]HCX04030.1 YihY/virulence factor BrkB family protein [Clostridiales bacterium]